MFEPFHPMHVRELSFLSKHHYFKPSENYPEFQAAVRRVFAGEYVHPRVDREKREEPIYERLVIKEIFATLLAKWAVTKFPWLRPVLLVRSFRSCSIEARQARLGSNAQLTDCSVVDQGSFGWQGPWCSNPQTYGPR